MHQSDMHPDILTDMHQSDMHPDILTDMHKRDMHQSDKHTNAAYIFTFILTYKSCMQKSE